MSNHLVGRIYIVVVAWKVQRWRQIKLESLIAAPITKTGRWNSGRRTLAGSYFCCAVLANWDQKGASLFFTVHFSYWVADIADQELEGKMWSAEIDQGLPRFEKTLHRSVVMELDTEVKLLPPAIQAFMTELGGAIPEVLSSSPYIFPLLALLPTFSHRSCSPHNLTEWRSPSPRFCFTAYSAYKGGCYYTMCSTQGGRSCASGVRRKVGILSPNIRYFSWV